MNFFYQAVKVSNLEIDKSVENVCRILANTPGPSLKELNLTPFAIEIAVAMSPMIGWKGKGGKYTVISGLRSLYLAQQLSETTAVPVLVVPKESVSDPRIFSTQSALIDLIIRAVDRRCSANLIPMLWEGLGAEQHRRQLSPNFVSIKGISDAAGINRRDFGRKPERLRSAFLALAQGES